MKSRDEKIRILERALRAAHRKEQSFPIKPGWRGKVMSHVLSLNMTPFQEDNIWSAPIIWRAVTVASTLALLVLLFSFNNNIGPEYEAARLFLEDPIGLTFLQPLFP